MLTTARWAVRRRLRARDDRGAIAVITSVLVCLVLMIVAALAVDVTNAWARRGLLQNQVDRAAVSRVTTFPPTTP